MSGGPLPPSGFVQVQCIGSSIAVESRLAVVNHRKQPVLELGGATLPAIVVRRREHLDRLRPGRSHRRDETRCVVFALLIVPLFIALGIDVNYLPVIDLVRAIGHAAEGLALAGARRSQRHGTISQRLERKTKEMIALPGQISHVLYSCCSSSSIGTPITIMPSTSSGRRSGRSVRFLARCWARAMRRWRACSPCTSIRAVWPPRAFVETSCQK